MSTKEESGAAIGAAQIVSLLVRAANGDTVFRDLYLERAAGQLSGVMPEREYRNLSGQQAHVDALLRQTQAEVRNQNWERVKDLSAEVDRLRHTLAQQTNALALASAVYDADYVHIDPFSSGLASFALAPGETLVSLRQALVAALRELAKADPPLRELYSERQRYFEQKVLPAAETSAERETAPKTGVAELQVQAQRAAERGDMATLRRLAEEITAASAAKQRPARPAVDAQDVDARSGWEAASTEPFPAASLERATKLGLEHVRTTEPFAGVPALLTDFVARHAWQPGAPAQDVAQEGAVHLRERLAALDLPGELKEPMVEMAALFALHPFINSGGVRYFGAGAGEYILVETFPEDAEPAAKEGVPALLRLDRRRGLARAEIDDALRTRGPAVLQEELGLDPREFRLVCVPFDVYVRVGTERGWGGQPQWTHVDGYAVRRGGQLGALAAGHVRYGGLQDLVIFGRADRRDTVTSRFCVVRRARFLLTAG
jgi:hypothetical protein